MFKLVVLSVVLAVAAAKPGYLHANPIVAPVAIPLATSHSSRVDYHSKPVIAVHAAPIVHAAPYVHTPYVHSAPIVHAAPIVHSAPVYHSVHAVPSAVSHQSRVDVHHSPVVAHVAHHVPAVHAVHAAPVLSAYAHAW